MAAAVYSCSSNESQVSTTLLWAKTKLASLKNLVPHPAARMTILRIELRAALLAEINSIYVRASWNFLDQVSSPSDSQVMDNYVQNNGNGSRRYLASRSNHGQPSWGRHPMDDSLCEIDRFLGQ